MLPNHQPKTVAAARRVEEAITVLVSNSSSINLNQQQFHSSKKLLIIHYLRSKRIQNENKINILLFQSGRTSTSTGMASMMDEMAKTLARRRAQAEKKPDVS